MSQLMVKKGEIKKLPPGQVFAAGIGWDPAQGQDDVDLDLWIVRKHESGAVDVVYWGEKDFHRADLGSNSEGNPFVATPELDIVYKGDDRTGAESDTGYDENADLDLSKTPADVVQYAIFATIYDGDGKGLTLGMATNVICGVTEAANGHELRTELVDDHGFDVTVLICTIDRGDDGKWSMNAVQTGYQDDMFSVARKLGVAF